MAQFALIERFEKCSKLSIWYFAKERASMNQKENAIFYVGSLSNPETSMGIYRFHCNTNNGALTLLDALSSGDENPTWLCFHPFHDVLYAANTIQGDCSPNPNGTISSFVLDTQLGTPKLLNTTNSGGSNPAHISLHPSGKWMFVANYGEAGNHSATVLEVAEDGSVGQVVETVKLPTEAVTFGAQPAVDAPTGSFAISGHDAPHFHQFECDPDGRFVLLTDLATDCIYVFSVDEATGNLKPTKQTLVCETSGAGPRHFKFHPNGLYCYVLNEEASTVSFYTYDGKIGELCSQQTISTLPEAYVGTSFASELVVSACGTRLYTLNRLYDSVAVMEIGPRGRLTWITEVWSRGSYPRHMAFDPSGRFLYVCNERSDNIASFKVDETGLEFLTHTAVHAPMFIDFHAKPLAR